MSSPDIVDPLGPNDALIFLQPWQLGVLELKKSMKLVYQYMTIFFNFSPTSNHLYPLQAENCDSNSRLVVDEDYNGKLRLERVNYHSYSIYYLTII